jgi:DNA-binding transcriptional ArsR family regulator
VIVHPFELFAEPVRRRLVEVLASGEHTSGELADVIRPEFAVGRTAVSNHLRILRDAEFVDVREEGPSRIYRLMWNALDRLDREVEHLLSGTCAPGTHTERTQWCCRALERSDVEIVPADDFWFR